MIDKVGKTDANVLILGENGTGKTLVAMALHKASLRQEHSFVHVDLGALNENLFESELFGHKKGAFTDAHEDKAGRFEVAHLGSLFLDEIGNLPVHLQAKLLSALQNKTVQQAGRIYRTHHGCSIDLCHQYALVRNGWRKRISTRSSLPNQYR